VTGDTAAWSFESTAVKAVLTVARKACSDGMSDRRYPFTATLQVGAGAVEKGCAIRPADIAAEAAAGRQP